MAESKPGWQTSEGRLTAIGSALALFGEDLHLFNVSSFSDDPVLMLIYRGLQLFAVITLLGIYTISRSQLKAQNGNSAESLIDQIKRNMEEKR
jgi:hypothetical protein